MSLTSVLSSRPTSFASCADLVSDEAIGSSVNARFLNDAAMTSGFRPLPVIFVIESLTTVWASAAFAPM